jgi:hypothetical protein
MGDMYENRSAVEHMNDPVGFAKDETDPKKAFAEMTISAEHVARHCIRNILLTPDLLKQYQDETTLASFWLILGPKERRKLWGSTFDILALLETIRG